MTALQSHLAAWIPLQTALRWILLEIDHDTGVAHEQLHQLSRGIGRYNAAVKADEEASHLHYDRASEILNHGLVDGSINATGYRSDTKRSEPISCDDWTRIRMNSRPWQDEIAFPGVVISDIRVRTDDIRRTIEAIEQAPSPVPARKVKSLPTKRQTEATYKDWIAQHGGKKPPARDEGEKYMKAQCGIGRDETRRLRDKLAVAAHRKGQHRATKVSEELRRDPGRITECVGGGGAVMTSARTCRPSVALGSGDDPRRIAGPLT